MSMPYLIIAAVLASNASGKQMVRAQPGTLVPSTGLPSGPLIAADASALTHVTWNGTAFVDAKGLAWTEDGTVTEFARAGREPAGATDFTDTNYIHLGTGTDPLDVQLGNDFTICVVYKVTAWTTTGHNASSTTLYGNGAYQSQGFVLDLTSTTTKAYTSRVGAAASVDGGATPLNIPSVVCFGRDADTVRIKLNGKATVEGAIVASFVKGTGLPARIGRDSNGTGLWLIGSVYEVYATTSAATDALMTDIETRVFQRLGRPAW